MKKIHSYNEWSSLKRVIVGSASNANWPIDDPVFKLEAERTLWKETPLPSGPVPQQIIDEANEDLNQLATVLSNLGVQVERPSDIDFASRDGMYNYCPRDRLLIYGDTVIDTAMMYPCRDMELEALEPIVGPTVHMPRDQQLVLDAANVLRLNNSMLMLESASGNKAAYDWLCNQFPDVNIELCNFYSGVHIDSTICALRDGFVMLNASRVNQHNCPEVFKGWTKLYVTDVEETDFYRYPYASKWIGLNVLSVDPNTVIVDSRQTQLIRDLERAKFTVIPLILRHSRTLGGGFHCVTLDLVRE